MRTLLTLFVVLTAASGSLLAQKRNITEKDLWDFVWVGDPQVSPDGSRAAFVRVTVAENVAGQIVYRWNSDAAGYSPASEFYVCLYQRKL